MTEQSVDAEAQWEDRIARSSLKLGDDATATALAEEFGDLDDPVANDLCNEAVRFVIMEGRGAISLEDFQSAWEIVQTQQEEEAEKDESEDIDSDTIEIPSSTTQNERRQSEDTPKEPVEEEEEPDDAQSANEVEEEQSRTPSQMERSELETEVEELRAEVEKLQSIAGRDIPLLKGALRKLLGPDTIDDITELVPAAEEFRAEHEDHARRIRAEDGQASTDGGGMTKVERAMEITRTEAVRVSTKGIRGGAVDYPTIRDIADRQYDLDLHSGTVYSAFDRLAQQWECFTVRDGSDGPNTENKSLLCDREKITQTLLSMVQMGGN